jgi:hypothetical protein
MQQRRRPDARYPSDDELIGLARELGSMTQVAVKCGVARESLRSFLSIRPELAGEIEAAIKAGRIDRFWDRIIKDGDCWLWAGPTGGNGYGIGGYGVAGAHHAHRAAWILANGKTIPQDMQIDHLCRNRLCVNPSHLELVSCLVNNRRKPHQGGGRPKKSG